MSTENIKTFAVLDLETNGLPAEQFNTCSITELSVYAFSAKCLDDSYSSIIDELGLFWEIPELPRVLHKLRLMINPKKIINPIAERVTGLSNEMLCYEEPFNVNAADCLLLFLKCLEKPICLVAHNGWQHDYPIIRYVFEKLKTLENIEKSMPSSIFCVDSYKAFREIDEKEDQIREGIKVHMKKEDADSRLYFVRSQFSDNFSPETKYPRKGDYKLGNIYKRIFTVTAENLHRAETDVAILTKLILHYGSVFLAYAEERKQSFDKVPILGSITN